MDVHTAFLNGFIEEEEACREKYQRFVVYGKDSYGYILLGQFVVGFREILKFGLVIEREREALLNIFP